MVDACKEMADITLEHPALSGAVLIPVVREKSFEPVQAEVQALVLLGCVVVQDKTAGDAVIEEIVHYGVLDHLVHKSGCLHQPFLGLIDIEHTKQTGSVNLGFEDIDQVDDVLKQVHLIVCGGSSGAFAPPGGKVCRIDHRKGAYFRKLHTNGWPPISVRLASLSSCAV